MDASLSFQQTIKAVGILTETTCYETHRQIEDHVLKHFIKIRSLSPVSIPSPAHSKMAERHDHKGKEVGDYQQHPVVAEMKIVKDWRQKYASGKLVLTQS